MKAVFFAKYNEAQDFKPFFRCLSNIGHYFEDKVMGCTPRACLIHYKAATKFY